MHAQVSRPARAPAGEREERESERGMWRLKGLKRSIHTSRFCGFEQKKKNSFPDSLLLRRELSLSSDVAVMLRARASSSSAAATLEALFGRAEVLTTTMTTTSILPTTVSTSSSAAFSSSSPSSQSLFAPWASRGECPPSTSTGGEATDGPMREFAGQPALIFGGRCSESSTLSSALFASASPFQNSLWQQQRRWMAVPKKKVRERESTDRERENNSGEELGLSFDRRLCFFPLSQPRPQSKHPQNSFTVVAPPPRDAQLGQVRP